MIFYARPEIVSRDVALDDLEIVDGPCAQNTGRTPIY